jgi:hypothetical protein
VTATDWQVPGYEAEELIGFGASGDVWRGRDTVTDETVALKRLRLPDAEGSARLKREAALQAALDHPHLLRLRDTIRTGEEWVLVVDYAAGGSLAALLRDRERLRPGEVVTALAPLAAALAYAHSEGLVHGDVTPANVLFTAEGRPLLADLGIARVVCDEDPVRATPEYVDPAVAGGSAPGPASDVFAVAAVAFHALTGRPPWVGATAEETLFAAATGEVPDLRELAPDAPDQLVRVLQRGLCAEPASRGSAAELALDLRHACTPEPVELGVGPTTVPAAAKPAPLTHEVRSRRAQVEPARRGRHGRPAAGRIRRPFAGLGRALSSKGLRAAVLGIVSVALAVRLGIAWAGAGAAQLPPDGGSLTNSATELPSVGSASPLAAASATAVPTVTGSAARWAAVLQQLDAVRQQAFADADTSRLTAVYAPGSTALTADKQQLGTISRAGERALDVHHVLTSVRVVRAERSRAVLAVRQSLAAYQLSKSDGLTRQPAVPAKSYRVTLVARKGGWLISELTLNPT